MRTLSSWRPGSLLALTAAVPSCTTAWISAYQAEKERAAALRPAAVHTEPVVLAAQTQYLRARVYADDDYRAQNINWERHVEKQLARANEILAGLGVQVEVAAFKVWPRRSVNALAQDLAELKAADPGEGVDLVVGYVTALPIFVRSLHDLGHAQVLGKHFVVRGMDDRAEYQGLMGAFQMLSEAKRTEIYYERKRHKEATVLVHEWAHTRGAIHVKSTDDFMHPSYSTSQVLFSECTGAIVRAGRDAPSAGAAVAGLRTTLDQLKGVCDWDAQDRDLLVAYLAEVETAASAPRLASESTPAPPPAAGKPTTPAGKRAQSPKPGRLSPEGLRLVDKDPAGCAVLGYFRGSAAVGAGGKDQAYAAAEASLRARAVELGGDTVAVMRKERGNTVNAAGAIYRCK